MIKEAIKKALDENGMDTLTLSKESGIRHSTLKSYLYDDADVTTYTAEKLMEVLDIRPYDCVFVQKLIDKREVNHR
jgi:lambda repressor-like predicted transcriptional regulator